ncbi:Fe(3+) dicitrate transport protein [Chryseolinea serpens]|uniref:Fe(3+) dicitrate transport protein n=1 Tax=Chryseolinea serpens TaxID=947013 RepID=A0A1M5MV22_9BACT|nr:TonB-dependent receptor [Chryseolinea serpens]SHG81131.1 Fe(3+) dicitrate transport protein [Chryseolinea serpens]
MNKSIRLLILFLWPCLCIRASAQTIEKDTIKSTLLGPVTVEGYPDRQHALPDVAGMNIFAGKKTDVINLRNGDANLPQNVGRTIFARMPGVNLWDMDGAGTQMNIGTRGTDAHRSIEMNMRQNGYNTNSDMFGYPENHYTAPMQGVKQVQLVRGSAALQFGSQFGGMMNYVMKEGDTSKVFSLESEQTVGSFNFFNSFNAIGGTKGKVNYYAYYDNRHGDGWRPNSAFNYQAMYASIRYRFSEKGSIAFQFSRMDYRQQIAGGQTDAMFEADARQSNRARNYFRPKINVPAILFNYALSPSTRLQITSHVVWGERSSVQFINTANVADTFNTAIGSYNPRQVDRDYYSGFATEARLLHRYEMGKIKGVLAGGMRYFNGHTKRRQKGKGTTGSDFDLSLIGPYGIDLKFSTLNYAAFVENVFYLGKNFSITPGFRYEVIKSDLAGVINNATFPVAYKGNRTFPLFGTGLQYQVSTGTQLYGNISQAYRPFLYANITPADQIGQIDPNLKDSQGYDVDAGYRGHLADFINFDVNAFYLFYGDKIGKVTAHASDNSTYLLTTNVGNSVAKGFEMYVSLSLRGPAKQNARVSDLRLFSSLAYTHARYTSGSVNNGASDISLAGKRVENVPDWIERGGLEFLYKRFSTTVQASYVSNQFNDANNTAFSATGLVGEIPAYTLYDWSFNWSFLKQFHVAGGVNNIADTRYFSRRINMYPGPGILPGDGRSFYLSLGFKI